MSTQVYDLIMLTWIRWGDESRTRCEEVVEEGLPSMQAARDAMVIHRDFMSQVPGDSFRYIIRERRLHLV